MPFICKREHDVVYTTDGVYFRCFEQEIPLIIIYGNGTVYLPVLELVMFSFLYVSLNALPKYRRHRDFIAFKEMNSVTYHKIEFCLEEYCHRSL